jgi:predicted GNAT family N-acyltransferase
MDDAVRTLTSATLADLQTLLELTAHVEWPHTRADWHDFLDCGRIWGHRDAQGRLVSCGALFEYGTALASIGVMIVHRERRGAGLAGALMRECMRAAHADILTLIATPFGLPVYEHLGFRTVDAVERLIGAWREPAPQQVASGLLSPLTGREIAAAAALDAQAYGAPRREVIARLAARAGASSAARQPDGRLTGFALAVPKTGMTQIAPVIAPDTSTAYALIAALARRVVGPLRVDVPRGHEALSDALRNSGLRVARVDPVLTLGGKALPGSRERVHAIAFQAFG